MVKIKIKNQMVVVPAEIVLQCNTFVNLSQNLTVLYIFMYRKLLLNLRNCAWKLDKPDAETVKWISVYEFKVH